MCRQLCQIFTFLAPTVLTRQPSHISSVNISYFLHLQCTQISHIKCLKAPLCAIYESRYHTPETSKLSWGLRSNTQNSILHIFLCHTNYTILNNFCKTSPPLSIAQPMQEKDSNIPCQAPHTLPPLQWLSVQLYTIVTIFQLVFFSYINIFL